MKKDHHFVEFYGLLMSLNLIFRQKSNNWRFRGDPVI